MRVLYLYFPGPMRSRTVRVSIYFYGGLKDHCDLIVFGPRAGSPWISRNYKVFPYQEGMQLQDVINETEADVVLFGGIRSFNYFYKQLKTNIPKVLLLNEYISLKEKVRQNVKKMAGFFDLSITRVRPNTRDYGIPAIWLPFSASDEFYTEWSSDYLDKRNKRIVYRGTTRGQYPYMVRRNAISILEESGLLAGAKVSKRNKKKYSVRIHNYPRDLKLYVGGLSCAWSDWGETPLKTFEIMASGTCLLTQQFNSIVRRELFDNRDDIYVTYKDDCKDIIKKAEGILYNMDKTKEITKNALDLINKNHLDKHRMKELYDILEALVKGKEIPRRWRYE